MSEVFEKKYPIGRIYKMSSSNELIYIGSTSQTLNARLSGHKNDYMSFLNGKNRITTSHKLFEVDSIVKIELLEEYKDISKIDLHKRERYFIELLESVNKFIPTRTQAEYETLNKDKILKKKKEKIICPICNCKIRKHAFKRHESTKKHIMNTTFNEAII